MLGDVLTEHFIQDGLREFSAMCTPKKCVLRREILALKALLHSNEDIRLLKALA